MSCLGFAATKYFWETKDLWVSRDEEEIRTCATGDWV